MQIGHVAESTGLSIDTIRFYEKRGLVPPAQRTSGGYRVYKDADVNRLRFIGRAQCLGFSLQEIRELLLIEEGQPDGCSHVRSLIAAKVEQVKDKIAVLRRIEKQLLKAQGQCAAALTNSCGARCPVLEQLAPPERKNLHEG